MPAAHGLIDPPFADTTHRRMPSIGALDRPSAPIHMDAQLSFATCTRQHVFDELLALICGLRRQADAAVGELDLRPHRCGANVGGLGELLTMHGLPPLPDDVE